MAEIFDTVLIVIHIMLVVALIGLILMQKSEGGALGIGGGGGGAGGGLMSARGAANALTKTTTILAAGFFATSVLLGLSAKNAASIDSVIEQIEQTQPTGVPTDAGDDAAPSSGGNLLEDLQRMGPQEPSNGVPTTE